MEDTHQITVEHAPRDYPKGLNSEVLDLMKEQEEFDLSTPKHRNFLPTEKVGENGSFHVIIFTGFDFMDFMEFLKYSSYIFLFFLKNVILDPRSTHIVTPQYYYCPLKYRKSMLSVTKPPLFQKCSFSSIYSNSSLNIVSTQMPILGKIRMIFFDVYSSFRLELRLNVGSGVWKGVLKILDHVSSLFAIKYKSERVGERKVYADFSYKGSSHKIKLIKFFSLKRL